MDDWPPTSISVGRELIDRELGSAIAVAVTAILATVEVKAGVTDATVAWTPTGPGVVVEVNSTTACPAASVVAIPVEGVSVPAPVTRENVTLTPLMAMPL
jgi:hypothetical protein